MSVISGHYFLPLALAYRQFFGSICILLLSFTALGLGVFFPISSQRPFSSSKNVSFIIVIRRSGQKTLSKHISFARAHLHDPGDISRITPLFFTRLRSQLYQLEILLRALALTGCGPHWGVRAQRFLGDSRRLNNLRNKVAVHPLCFWPFLNLFRR